MLEVYAEHTPQRMAIMPAEPIYRERTPPRIIEKIVEKLVEVPKIEYRTNEIVKEIEVRVSATYIKEMICGFCTLLIIILILMIVVFN